MACRVLSSHVCVICSVAYSTGVRGGCGRHATTGVVVHGHCPAVAQLRNHGRDSADPRAWTWIGRCNPPSLWSSIFCLLSSSQFHLFFLVCVLFSSSVPLFLPLPPLSFSILCAARPIPHNACVACVLVDYFFVTPGVRCAALHPSGRSIVVAGDAAFGLRIFDILEADRALALQGCISFPSPSSSGGSKVGLGAASMRFAHRGHVLAVVNVVEAGVAVVDVLTLARIAW